MKTPPNEVPGPRWGPLRQQTYELLTARPADAEGPQRDALALGRGPSPPLPQLVDGFMEGLVACHPKAHFVSHGNAKSRTLCVVRWH